MKIAGFTKLHDDTATLLRNPVLGDESEFQTLVQDTARQVVRVLQKYVDKVYVGMTGFRGGPGDPRGEESFRNEGIQRDLQALRELDPNHEGWWLICLFPPNPLMGGGETLRVGYKGIPLLADCSRVLGEVPDAEPDWNAEWQVKLDTILVAQQALQMRWQHEHLSKQLKKWLPEPDSEADIPSDPLAGVSAFLKKSAAA